MSYDNSENTLIKKKKHKKQKKKKNNHENDFDQEKDSGIRFA